MWVCLNHHNCESLKHPTPAMLVGLTFSVFTNAWGHLRGSLSFFIYIKVWSTAASWVLIRSAWMWVCLNKHNCKSLKHPTSAMLVGLTFLVFTNAWYYCQFFFFLYKKSLADCCVMNTNQIFMNVGLFESAHMRKLKTPYSRYGHRSNFFYLDTNVRHFLIYGKILFYSFAINP